MVLFLGDVDQDWANGTFVFLGDSHKMVPRKMMEWPFLDLEPYDCNHYFIQTHTHTLTIFERLINIYIVLNSRAVNIFYALIYNMRMFVLWNKCFMF